MTNAKEKLGQAIDRVDNVYHATMIPMPAEFHLKQMQALLPEIIAELKQAFEELTGEKVWD